MRPFVDRKSPPSNATAAEWEAWLGVREPLPDMKQDENPWGRRRAKINRQQPPQPRVRRNA